VKYTLCPICSKQIANNNYNKHVEAHSKPSRYLRPLDHDDLYCKYCNKLCKNKNSLAQHEIRCSKNTSALKVQVPENFISQKPWNKGLTKDSDIRVAKLTDKVTETLQQKVSAGWKPFFATKAYWTEEAKAKRSADKIEFYREHPEKHPNRILASNNVMTYPEQLAADWLTKNNINYVYQYKTSFENKSRFVDFFLVDYNMYLEIDGEYWHAKSEDVDRAKDLFAMNEQGIKTLRIKPKLGIEVQLEKFLLQST
jgi:very-short-patch-repair endonuclease